MVKYQAIYKDLLEKIESGYYKINTYLPTEENLSEIYDASRDTIRKSLNMLLQSGYIQKIKGKGSLILDYNRIDFPVSGITSFKELEKAIQGEIKTYVNIFLQSEITEDIKDHLSMDRGKIYHIERIREIDNEKVILDIDYLNGEIIKDLTVENAENSIYEYIEKDLGLTISFAKKEITVVKANNREKSLLDMKDFDLLVCVKSYTYLDDGRLFEYTISKHRPDKFRFVDFARRNGIKTIWTKTNSLFLFNQLNYWQSYTYIVL